MDIRKIEKVDSKPEVNIFLNKPFIADEKNSGQNNKDNGFQGLLDHSMDELKKQDSKFDNAIKNIVEEVYEEPKEHVLTTREVQLLELRRARKEFERIHGYSKDERGPMLKK